MRAVVQCVSEASVTVEGRVVGAIGKGYAILLGVGHGDTEAEAERLWRKIAKMRVFEDAQGKTNLSLADVGGEVLVVSQFTLYANCRKGNLPRSQTRPSQLSPGGCTSTLLRWPEPTASRWRQASSEP